MPQNSEFTVHVLVADKELPENCKEGATYVESNLWTPVSYRQRVREVAYGEIEEQEWPVTPYEVKVSIQPHCPESWFSLYVDGVFVSRQVLLPKSRNEWVFDGFHDHDGTREFLFALPRFARDENDRLLSDRKSKVGTIEVVQHGATFVRTEYRTGTKGDTVFDQANKKDAHSITNGQHTMSTTKKGKVIGHSGYGSRLTSIYDIGPELGRLSLHYRMAHTLQDMGITIKKPKSVTATKQERK